MNEAVILVCAFLLDLAIGDPRCLPHPVRIIGWCIDRSESAIRRFASSPEGERAGGIILVLSIVLPVYGITFLIDSSLSGMIATGGIAAFAGYCGLVFLTATTIALRDLADSAMAVIRAVGRGSIEEARGSLGMIVGRDTGRLEKEGILKATIETLSENLSDGIIAPLFYFAIGGLPLAMAYKAVNTLDSMVGYKNDRYRFFGWAAARLDDIANFIPARMSGVLIVAAIAVFRLSRQAGRSVAGGREALSVMMRDGRKHSSPNSGVPEAAMAGGLGVRLGGPSTYGGVLFDKPYIGDEKGSDYLEASIRTLGIVRLASLLGLLLSVGLILIRRSL